jgi:hypothetical protein
MRSGWGTKIIDAVESEKHIFSPSNEQLAVDQLGLGRIMIKALRYWSVAMGLTEEGKDSDGITQEKTSFFDLVAKNDRYFQDNGSLLVLHRNLVLNQDDATAWYWLFNEWELQSISKEEFSDAFHTYLAVNGMKIKKDAVDKEFNCVRSTYVGDQNFDIKSVMDEDTYPFFGPLGILKVGEDKRLVKSSLTSKDIPLELLVYFIALDNPEESRNQNQINIDRLLEEKGQIGKYLNMRYSRLVEMLLEAENKGYISLNNNFGNRYIEFWDRDYSKLLVKYYTGKED